MAKKKIIRQVRIPQIAVNGNIVNRQNRAVIGTLPMICSQHGLSRKKNGDYWIISGPTERIQKFVEAMHFASIPYDVA